MAKRKFKVPIALVAGIAAGIVTRRPAWGASPVELIMQGRLSQAFDSIVQSYLGYNAPRGYFDPSLMKHGLLPLIAGVLVHKFVGGAPLNVNRSLANAGVPIIRI